MNSRRAPSCTPYLVNSPLWSRAPARDEQGQPFIDFMMIIPGLKTADQAAIENCLFRIRQSLEGFDTAVVYVDLNVKLNLLWISARPLPGITRRIVCAIQHYIPEAKVVAAEGFHRSGVGSSRSTNWLVYLNKKVKESIGMISKA